MRRIAFTYRSIALLAMLTFICSILTVSAQTSQPGARRALPKPPRGSRGFEQYAERDASTRLIAMGATREVTTPRKPYAPLLGLAYSPRPFFSWAPAFGSKSYRFVLYDDDVYAKPTARAIFETDVASTEFNYPANRPALTSGKLYSWRVFTNGGKEAGPAVAFFVLADRDASEVRSALGKANLLTPRTEAERIKQMTLFWEYGVWYDALRIASEIAAKSPDDPKMQQRYEDLLSALEGK